MIKINIEMLLKRNGKTKYWLCKRTGITARNLNRIINGETTSISFNYIEIFCELLNTTPAELITIEKETNNNSQ